MNSPSLTFADALPSLGEETGSPITVRISNEILTLLSSQLYQSPLKAIEELVVNSYDANANECRLFVPKPDDDLQAVLVYDDGIGMDADGLSDLWLVGRSSKRDPAYQRRMARKQIGKFGIGKLATYAISNNVTYISRSRNDVLAVSANFEQFRKDPQGTVPVELNLTRIESWDKLQEPGIFRAACEAAGVEMNVLFGTDPASWTIVLLENMKPKPIRPGRLRWVLSTAMPLQAGFRLYLNYDEILSSKEDSGVVSRFDVTELSEKRIESVSGKTKETWRIENGALISASFPEGVRGSAIVTKRSLHTGKSADLGRSHGFFVKVRGRLVNEEDPLLGLSPLSYQTFNRFRADLSADDLDEAVTAPREGVGESPLRDNLSALLAEVFYEARDRYESHLKELEKEGARKREQERSYVPARLVEHPIADVLSLPSLVPGQGAEADESWFYLEVGTKQEADELVKDLYTKPRTQKYKYQYVSKGRQGRLVEFNPKQSTFYLNQDHDLVAEYREDARAAMLLEDIATAEAVLEIYLREHGMAPHVVGELLQRRDSLLRGLANDHVFSVDTISQLLKDSTNDKYDLEVNLVAASRALGFVATHLGGAGEPDGIARFTDYPNGEQKITLEAKSSGSVPDLGHLDFAGLKEHVTKRGANGCLLVAPMYPGESLGTSSSASARALDNSISCWTVDDLARVVQLVETRHIGAKEVLDIVLNQFAPDDVSAAVERLLNEPTWERRSLYVAVLDALRGLEGRLVDQPRTVSHIAAEVTRQPGFEEVPQGEIKRAVADLSGASEGTLILESGDRIIANASFDEIERRLRGLTGEGGEPRRGGTFRDSSDGSEDAR